MYASTRKNKTGRATGTKACSWLVSVCIHAAVLLAFGLITFTQARTDTSNKSASATVRQVEKVVNSRPVMPKPRVVSANIGTDLFKLEMSSDLSSLATISGTENRQALSRLDGARRAGIEFGSPAGSVSFFGNVSCDRKICYVVDCSGSMLGFYYQVRRNLIDSISALEQDHFFNIILFREGSFVILAENGLVRASDAGKARAVQFVEKYRPSGRNEGIEALKRAMRLRDSFGQSMGVIYFLTDGFDFEGPDSDQFCSQVEQMRKSLCSTTRIHTVGFGTEQADREMLRTIAIKSGGKFVEVNCE